MEECELIQKGGGSRRADTHRGGGSEGGRLIFWAEPQRGASSVTVVRGRSVVRSGTENICHSKKSTENVYS